jgi:hypothetical protein
MRVINVNNCGTVITITWAPYLYVLMWVQLSTASPNQSFSWLRMIFSNSSSDCGDSPTTVTDASDLPAGAYEGHTW